MPDTQDWPEPPIAADEGATLLAFLERQRATLAWKTAGLDADGLRATLGPSSMTLGGMLKHLAHMEANIPARLLLGQPPGPPWDAVDWDAEPDWAWASAAADSPEELRASWRDAADRTRAVLAEAMAAAGPDQLGRFTTGDGRSPTLRYIVLTMIEEYARHNGHVDLLRESVDGLTGEDPRD